jgi:hypothetical protein
MERDRQQLTGLLASTTLLFEEVQRLCVMCDVLCWRFCVR